MGASSPIEALGGGDLVAGVLVLFVVGVLGVSLIAGLLDRVIARIGLRNFARGRTRTLVLLIGLLIGTTIISSSLVIGDTVNTLTVHYAYVQDGAVDEAVYAPASSTAALSLSSSSSYAYLPWTFYSNLNTSMAHRPGVAGLTPMILAQVGAFDTTRNLAQSGLNLVGAPPAASGLLGDFTSTSGRPYASPGAEQVFLDPTAAQALDASVGDHLTLSGAGGLTLNLTVGALVAADTRGGFQDLGSGDVFTTLAVAQNLTGTPASLNYIAVTNTGGLTGGVAQTSTVWGELNSTVPATVRSTPDVPAGITDVSVLQNDIASAESGASSITTLFLVLGLFSIMAGSFLIVGIFAMLAEERRGEMGVARAVGMRRGQLQKAYYFEGLAYSVGSAFLGTFLGVGVGYLLVYVFSTLITAGSTLTPGVVLSSFTVTTSSLITAYSIGFLLTLATVSLTVVYISRINIVRSIRNLPEPPLTRRSWLRVAAGGVGLAVIGGLLLQAGLVQGSDLDIGLLGISLMILAGGFILTALVPLRYAMTVAALGLIVFWGDQPLHTQIFGSHHTGTIFVFFQEGVFLIAGSVLLYLFNSDIVVGAVAALVRRRGRTVPVVKIAFSYPAHKRFRTAMTVSIFAMVLFTVIAIASIENGLVSEVNNVSTAETGGYQLAGFSSAPIPNLASEIEKNRSLNDSLQEAIPFYTGGAVVGWSGLPSDQDFPYSLASAPTSVPSWQDFYTSNQYNFTSTYHGLSSSQVWKELETDPHVAVVDGSFTPTGLSFITGGHPTLQVGTNLTLSTSGPRQTVQVIGILGEQFVPVVLVNPTFMTRTMGFNGSSFFMFRSTASADVQQLVYDLKTAFFTFGLQIINFQQDLQSELQSTFSLLDLMQVFVALGLVVGIAAIGILALRAVVERRSEIGMVRALGFRKVDILWSFLIEYSFLALLGIGIGVALGVLLAYNLSQIAAGLFAFSVPWFNIGLAVAISYGLTLVATAWPSAKAARMAPAEAIRYSE